MSNAAVIQQSTQAAVDWQDDYNRLIEEVYIDPIRSVVVVDDDFPTLDAFIKKTLSEKSGSGNSESANDAGHAKDDVAAIDVEAVHDILSFCREKERPWLVDVHDGREVKVDDEMNIASHLHHSDLMILDYHLAGQNGGGEKSIKILKKLAKSPHFNIVAVYTKGYEGDDFQKVFYEIATALTFKNFNFLSKDDFEKTKDAIGKWEELNENISNILPELITAPIYLKERADAGSTTSGPIGQRIQELLNADQYREVSKKQVIAYLLQDYHQEKIISAMSDENYGHLHLYFDKQINWIKTDSLFLTVVHKKNKAKGIEQQVKNALFGFCPDPHQLLMAKMRAQIDEAGAIAETAVLSNKYMQAGWLSDLFDKDTNNSQIIKGTVNRHWEALGDQLKSDIDSFAERLLKNVSKRGEKDVTAKYSEILKNEEDAVLHHINLYNSTKPVSHSHLMTGHVLQMPNEKNSSSLNLWVCLSPACDLVPGQKTTGWRGKLGSNMPFMAVQLEELKASTAIKNIQQNIYLFLDIKGEIKTFTFCPAGDPLSSPLWEQMFASDKGKFVDGSNKLNVYRVHEDNGSLLSKIVEVEVVAQLRYEYALNLLQRLGGTFSRIGLDFKSRRIRN